MKDFALSKESMHYYIVLIIVVIIVVAVAIVWYFYSDKPIPADLTPATPPAPPGDRPLRPIGPGDLVDCARFSTESMPTCAPGNEEYRGRCYKDVWSQEGGRKTAICTVDWGRYGGVYTRCGIGIYDLEYGAPCPMVGPGYHKTAWCTCQLRGIVTASSYCKYEGLPNTCPTGSDSFAGRCYREACPTGYRRIARCTCEPVT